MKKRRANARPFLLAADFRFGIADRQFVREICISENRFSKIDIDNRLLLMQIVVTKWRSAIADLNKKAAEGVSPPAAFYSLERYCLIWFRRSAGASFFPVPATLRVFALKLSSSDGTQYASSRTVTFFGSCSLNV